MNTINYFFYLDLQSFLNLEDNSFVASIHKYLVLLFAMNDLDKYCQYSNYFIE